MFLALALSVWLHVWPNESKPCERVSVYFGDFVPDDDPRTIDPVSAEAGRWWYRAYKQGMRVSTEYRRDGEAKELYFVVLHPDPSPGHRWLTYSFDTMTKADEYVLQRGGHLCIWKK